jgi:3-deoxy-D-arabino-heptulosonate 7-phosphate (DAHP) synthase class II
MEKFPEACARKQDLDGDSYRLSDHVLWMSEQMETWDATSVKMAAKAGR